MAFVFTKPTMLVAYLALIAGSQPKLLSGSVTYTNRGARLERLLPELSKACGLELAPDKRMRDVVLTLRLRDAPTTEVLKKIAYAARGKWEEIGSTYVLHSDDAGIASIADGIAKRWRAKVGRMIAASKSALLPLKPGEMEHYPVAIAIAKLLPSMDQQPMMQDDWSRLVYSTNPKPLQIALPDGADAVFAEMADSIRRQQTDQFIIGLRDEWGLPWEDGTPARTNLLIENESDSNDNYLFFGIIAYDAKGEIIGRAGTVLRDPEDHSKDIVENKWGIVQPGKDDKEEGGVTLEPLQVVTPVNETSVAGAHGILMHPIEHDPAQHGGDVLIAYAERKNVQLVAGMSDPLASNLAESGVDERRVWQIVKWAGGVNSNGWLTMRRIAEDPEHDSWLIDRHKVQSFIDSFVDDPHPSLETLVHAFRAGLKDICKPQSTLFPNLLRDEENFEQGLGLLTDDQISAMLAGKRVSLGDTPDAFQKVFVDDCFNSNREPMLHRDSGDTPFNDYIEPTELVEAKIAAGAYLVLHRTDKTGLEDAPNGSMFTHYTDLDNLAYQIASDAAVGKFRIGTTSDYDLRVYLTPGIYWEAIATIRDVATDKPFVSVSQFPADLKAALQKLVAEKRKQQSGDETGRGGGAPPPS